MAMEEMTSERSRAFTTSSVPEAYDRWLSPQLFEPWAIRLLDRAPLHAADSVLDVATGPGTVARLAASRVGNSGRVVGSDISGAMLAVARAHPADRGAAAIDWLEAPATALSAEDGTFDVVVCQQGLQFFPDRSAAVAEMRRVTRRGGTVVASTWASERPLGLFGPMIEAMLAAGVPEPFPRAYDPTSYCLDERGLSSLFEGAGTTDVEVTLLELDAVWEDVAQATATVFGTPYGPLVQSLEPTAMTELLHDFGDRLGATDGGLVSVPTAAHVVTGRC